jgi:hypothetical protein
MSLLSPCPPLCRNLYLSGVNLMPREQADIPTYHEKLPRDI